MWQKRIKRVKMNEKNCRQKTVLHRVIHRRHSEKVFKAALTEMRKITERDKNVSPYSFLFGLDRILLTKLLGG